MRNITIKINRIGLPESDSPILGYVGENETTSITVVHAPLDGVIEELWFELPDGTVYSRELTDGKLIVDGAILSLADNVKIQWIAVDARDRTLIAKSAPVLLTVGDSISGEPVPIPPAEELRALRDEVQSIVDAAEAGEYDGKDGKDGEDYVITPADYDAIADDVRASIIVPTKTSDLTNDSGFVDSGDVSQAIADAIGSQTIFNIQVVNELPQVGNPNTLYFVRNSSEVGNEYQEYFYLNNTWELVGTARIDLSNYVTQQGLTYILNDYATKQYVASQIPIHILAGTQAEPVVLFDMDSGWYLLNGYYQYNDGQSTLEYSDNNLVYVDAGADTVRFISTDDCDDKVVERYDGSVVSKSATQSYVDTAIGNINTLLEAI